MNGAIDDAQASGTALPTFALGVGRIEILVIVMVLLLGLHGYQRSAAAGHERSVATVEAETARFLARIEGEFNDLGDALESSVATAWRGRTTLANIGWFALLEELDAKVLHVDTHGAALAAALPRDRKAATGRRIAATQVSSSASSTSASPSDRLQVIRGVGAATGALRPGIDLYRDAGTRLRANKARDEGRATMHVVPGAIDTVRASLFAPLYAIESPWGLRDRRSQFAGVVIVPFDLEPILSDAMEAHPGLAVTISVDGTTLLTGTTAQGASGHPGTLMRSRELLGQTIDFSIAPTTLLGNVTGTAQTRLWSLQAGVTAMMLLLLFAYRAARLRRVQIRLTDHALERTTRIVELEATVARLESFAYVVSHDLKTPLRKMQGLTEALAEELESVDGGPTASRGIEECLSRLHDQGQDMGTLIDGVGEYSRALASVERIETIDTRTCLESVAATIGIPAGGLRLVGDFPKIRTTVVRFEQTVANLVGNAWKYHDRQQEAIIEVSVAGFGDYWLFAVRDDGPGIDPVHHRRIFEAFEAVRVPGVESSGIGLSIVRAAVDSVGGQLSLESSPGNGSTFRFTWPKDFAGTA